MFGESTTIFGQSKYHLKWLISQVQSLVLFWTLFEQFTEQSDLHQGPRDHDMNENSLEMAWLIFYESTPSTETKARQIFSTFSIIEIRFVEGFCSIFHCFFVFIPEIPNVSFTHPDLPNPAANQRIPYQVKSDLLEFGDSVVLSPRRIDPRADKAGRPFWFFTIGIDSLAIR